jgi:hypothetical protein
LTTINVWYFNVAMSLLKTLKKNSPRNLNG